MARGGVRMEALDNDEIRMTNVEGMPKPECPKGPARSRRSAFVIRIWDFFRHWAFVIRHSYLSASIGFTVAARWAGTYPAKAATRIIKNAARNKVTGSV